jgi:hypothetical protein
MARERTETVPVPRPKAREWTSMTMGNVKLMAANCAVPNLDTKYVSARLNATIAKIPITMGTVR